MQSENGDVIQIETTGRQQRIENGANFPGRYIEMRMRRVHLSMRTEGIKAFSNGYGVVVWMGENDTKTISVDANLFENGAKHAAPFSFENGLVWTGPKQTTRTTATRTSLNKRFNEQNNSCARAL